LLHLSEATAAIYKTLQRLLRPAKKIDLLPL
jgi:hypothetical protein